MKRLLVLTLCFFVLGANTGKDPKFDTMILKDQGVTSISNAPSSSIRQIVRSGALYLQDSSGVETQVGSGSGGINYVSSNPGAESATTGWSTYDDGAASTPTDCTGGTVTSTYARNTTTPLRGNGDFKLTRSSGTYQGEGAFFSFTIPKADYSKALSISFDYDTDEDTAYTAGDLKVYLIRDTGGTPTLVTPSFTSIPYGAGKFQATFVSTTDDDWRLCFHQSDNTSEAWDAYIDNVVVGPSEIVQSAPVSEWISYTPTISNVTTSATFGRYRRIGSAMDVDVGFTSSAAATGVVTIGIPSGHTIDSSSIAGNSITSISPVGVATMNPASGNFWTGVALYNNASNTTVRILSDNRSNYWSASIPYATASGDKWLVRFTVPISEWSGSATGLTNSRVEYACVSSTWDAADLTAASISYGPSGCSITGALTSDRYKRVRFQTAIQPTDIIKVQVSDDGIVWNDVCGAILSGNIVSCGLNSAWTATSGAFVGYVSGSTTDVDVYFGQYMYIANDDAPTGAWTNGDKWRVVKSANPLAVGFDSSNIVGVQSGTAASAGYVGEVISSTLASGAATSLSTGTAKTITSITLTPGDWELSGMIAFNAAAGTTVTHTEIAISKTGNNVGGGGYAEPISGEARNRMLYASYTPGGTISMVLSNYQYNTSTSVTLYLVGLSQFATSTMTGSGYIQARRVR